MAWRVNQIQDVFFSLISIFHLDGVTFYGNPTFAFQVHIVQQLRFFLARRNRMCGTKKSVGKRTFSVINVRNNAKIPYVFHSLFMSIYVQLTAVEVWA
jgi:hypothetical protein